MWVAKFKIKHDNCWLVPRAKKYNLSVASLPLTSYTKKGKKYHLGLSFLKGKDYNKHKFIKSLSSDPRVKKSTLIRDQLFVLVEGEEFITHVFDPELFFISPIMSKDGFEYWEIGSWDRKKLISFFTRIRTIALVEMLKLKRETPKIFIHQAVPHLTKKQQEAWSLALQNGYYTYPRKISVQELAQRVRVPRTTFMEHLRKAEAKMMGVLESSF